MITNRDTLYPRLPYSYDKTDEHEHVSIPIEASRDDLHKEWNVWETKLNDKTIRRLQIESIVFLILWLLCVYACWFTWNRI
jgi:hypothetical protein